MTKGQKSLQAEKLHDEQVAVAKNQKSLKFLSQIY